MQCCIAGALSEFHLIRLFQLRPRLPPFPAFLELGLGFLEGSDADKSAQISAAGLRFAESDVIIFVVRASGVHELGYGHKWDWEA